MAEIFSIITGITATLDQSLKLFQTIRAALKSTDELHKLFNQHAEEVSRVNQLVVLVRDEESLQTAAVKVALQDVEKHGKELEEHLKYIKFQVERNRLEQIGHALSSGSDDKNTLRGIMQVLGNSKMNLLSYILICNVGLVRGVDNSVKVNTTTLESLDGLIKSRLGIEDTLRIKKLVGDRQSSDDGLVTLTPEDIAVLSIDKPSEATTDVTAAKEIIRKRTIRGNTSLHTSLMLNTTVSAQDIWKDIDELTIENNTSKDNSTMVNYPIQTDDLVKILRAQRGTE